MSINRGILCLPLVLLLQACGSAGNPPVTTPVAPAPIGPQSVEISKQPIGVIIQNDGTSPALVKVINPAKSVTVENTQLAVNVTNPTLPVTVANTQLPVSITNSEVPVIFKGDLTTTIKGDVKLAQEKYDYLIFETSGATVVAPVKKPLADLLNEYGQKGYKMVFYSNPPGAGLLILERATH